MNYDGYATAITDELRFWVHEWLAGVYASWALHDVLQLPLPHQNYPLPPTFPFGAFSTWQVSNGCTSTAARTSCDTATPWPSPSTDAPTAQARLWRGKSCLVCDVELGVFEIAGPIYDARSLLPFTLGSQLVLEALLASLATRRPVRLGSHIIRLPDGSDMDAMAQRTPASAVQFFELRTPEEQSASDSTWAYSWMDGECLRWDDGRLPNYDPPANTGSVLHVCSLNTRKHLAEQKNGHVTYTFCCNGAHEPECNPIRSGYMLHLSRLG
ncbi:hypothetical protein B0H13DRAFT_2504995 [Mycena leptocephala]|nr:hypothetical protein B0H13DRAFT_2504995 [Mycena leptocephala]